MKMLGTESVLRIKLLQNMLSNFNNQSEDGLEGEVTWNSQGHWTRKEV